MLFVYVVFYGIERGCTWHGARVYHTFSTRKKRGEIIVPPVVVTDT